MPSKYPIRLSEAERLAWEWMASLSPERQTAIMDGIREERDRQRAKWAPWVQRFAEAARRTEIEIITDTQKPR